MTETKRSKEREGTLKLSGAISIYEVAGIHKKLLRSLEENKTVRLDLGEVTSCDTAGIQLLLAAGKRGEGTGKRVILLKSPEAVREAARCIGVEPDIWGEIHGGYDVEDNHGSG
jgi:anti-sigma B factor antagonist